MDGYYRASWLAGARPRVIASLQGKPVSGGDAQGEGGVSGTAWRTTHLLLCLGRLASARRETHRERKREQDRVRHQPATAARSDMVTIRERPSRWYAVAR